MTFAVSEIDGVDHAVVNVLTFDDAETMEFDILSTDFDGETVDKRLQRRARNWIPNVTVAIESRQSGQQ
jgi:hypothetical protein